MKVIKKDGTKKNYKLTLKMLGYPNGYKWHYVEYGSIIKALEKIYPELQNNIERAYL